MIATLYAELARLARRRVLIATGIAALIFAFGGAAIVLSSAESVRAGGAAGLIPTLEDLQSAGGGSEVFRGAVAFAGTLIFVVIVGLTAIEFSRGTVRTMLLRQPQRLRLLAGKVLAMLVFAAGALAVLEVLMWGAAYLLAPTADVSTSAWLGLDAVGHAIADYGTVLLWIAGYTVFGTTVAVLVRSVPLSLAIGVAWAGPIEHLLQDAWSPAARFFPGLLLEALAAGGSADVSAGRAIATVLGYVVVAGAITATVFARRDVTS